MNFEEKIIERLKRLEREVERLRVWERPAGGSAESDPTVVGWSGTPAKTITYVVIGKLLLMSIYVSGTSNSTSTRVYLPTGITGVTQGPAHQWAACRIENNGVESATSGMAGVPNGAAYIDFYINWAGNNWFATGVKTISGNFAWIIN